MQIQCNFPKSGNLKNQAFSHSRILSIWLSSLSFNNIKIILIIWYFDLHVRFPSLYNWYSQKVLSRRLIFRVYTEYSNSHSSDYNIFYCSLKLINFVSIIYFFMYYLIRYYTKICTKTFNIFEFSMSKVNMFYHVDLTTNKCWFSDQHLFSALFITHYSKAYLYTWCIRKVLRLVLCKTHNI